MEKEKVLFQVAIQGENCHVTCDCEDVRQEFKVAFAMYKTLVDSRNIAYMLSRIIDMSDDPAFKKAIDESVVEISDFNSILKQ